LASKKYRIDKKKLSRQKNQLTVVRGKTNNGKALEQEGGIELQRQIPIRQGLPSHTLPFLPTFGYQKKRENRWYTHEKKKE
jgi:hypothetical protein